MCTMNQIFIISWFHNFIAITIQNITDLLFWSHSDPPSPTVVKHGVLGTLFSFNTMGEVLQETLFSQLQNNCCTVIIVSQLSVLGLVLKTKRYSSSPPNRSIYVWRYIENLRTKQQIKCLLLELLCKERETIHLFSLHMMYRRTLSFELGVILNNLRSGNILYPCKIPKNIFLSDSTKARLLKWRF